MKESTPLRGDRRGNSLRIAAAALAINCLLASVAFGQFSISPTQIQCASQAVGTTSAVQTITVTNTGAPAWVQVGVLFGPDASSFVGSNGCFSAPLATGASCTITVSFAPLRTGSHQATLGLGTYAFIPLSGNATGTQPTYALPHYELKIVDPPEGYGCCGTGGTANGDLWDTTPLGFNNHDEFAGFARFFYTNDCYGRSSETGDTLANHAFVFAGGKYTYLNGGQFGVSSLGCLNESVAVGIDDAGEVFGYADLNYGLPGAARPTFLYADGTISTIVPSALAFPGSSYTPLFPIFVAPSGIVLFNNLSYWFNGQLTPFVPPPYCSTVGCNAVIFDIGSRSWITTAPGFEGASHAYVNTGGFGIGRTFVGGGVYRNGIITISGAYGFDSVNTAGQAVGPDGYWDQITGLRPLDSLLPPGWTAYTAQPGLTFINDAGHILMTANYLADAGHWVILTPILTMPTGNVVAQSGSTTLNFSNVTSPGTTTVTPIDASTTGTVPGGFAISDTVAYQLSTTATFTGPVTVSFVVPGPMSEGEFNNLRVLHNENGSLVDITTGYDYSRMTIFATTTSFSPFYLARLGMHIAPLFDTTKAYKAGSTVPIKLQVLDAANANVSSAALKLKARKLIRLQDSTQTSVIDSGNSNPDSDFRFDSTIGGTGGYIYNLSTKNLNSGRYSLSMNVGSDKGFVYSVSFEVR